MVREAIRRTYRLADENARRLGISRRRFLTGVTGAAATLFVLGACSKEEASSRGESPGGTFDVSEDATRRHRDRRSRSWAATSSSSTSRPTT